MFENYGILRKNWNHSQNNIIKFSRYNEKNAGLIMILVLTLFPDKSISY